MSLLCVQDLQVSLRSEGHLNLLISRLSFDIDPAEILCIVGESGSGKSMTARAIMGLLPRGARTQGSVKFEGTELLDGSAGQFRGRQIGMVFQEPMTALNPVLTIGLQMTESLCVLEGVSQRVADVRALELLERVGIDGGRSRLRQYPHEFSGGMRQRVMIAMAMMSSPKLIIADEPTTALDVTIQAQILELMRSLVKETGMGLILITHDMGVVAQMADRVVVMREGRAVESAAVKPLFDSPASGYTKRLLAAVPRLDAPSDVPEPVELSARAHHETSEQALVEIRNVTKTFMARGGWLSKSSGTRALQDVSLTLNRSETVALVGESGSGKSTLGRAVARLGTIDQGSILVNGLDIAGLSGKALRAVRAKTQMIFQDPYSSLNPRFRIIDTVAEPMIIQGMPSSQANFEATRLLARVGFEPEAGQRFPHEFSGGQRQRIAIARALAPGPAVLIADEPTSALDVSIQAQILELLEELQQEQQFAMLFISHDLAVVRNIADRVAVMQSGRIVEMGTVSAVLDTPGHRYTRLLIDSVPVPDPGRRSVLVAHSYAVKKQNTGPLQQVNPGHWVAT